MDHKMAPQGTCVYCFSIFVSNTITFLCFLGVGIRLSPSLLSYAVCSKTLQGTRKDALQVEGSLAQLSLAWSEQHCQHVALVYQYLQEVHFKRKQPFF